MIALEIEKYPRLFIDREYLPTFKFLLEEMTESERCGNTAEELCERIYHQNDDGYKNKDKYL